MKIRALASAIVVFTAAVFLTCAYAGDVNKDIFVSNAWVRLMPPSLTTTAGYMTIVNNSQKEAILVSASSDIAGTTEIHQMSDMNGMMKMGMVGNLHIPAQGKVVLQPGGFHLMLIGLKKPLHKGEAVPMTLHFQDGSEITLNAQVKPVGEQGTGNQEGSSGMSGMKM